MKLYIAGPMSGIPQFNFPAFFAAGDALRAAGYEVVNPAEIDHEEDKGLAMKSKDGQLSKSGHRKTWGDFLMRDVKLIADQVDGIAVLPGWENSRGARLECFVAATVQKPVFNYEDMNVIPPEVLMDIISQHVVNQTDTKRRYG